MDSSPFRESSAQYVEASLQSTRAQTSHMSTTASVQEPARSLWKDITNTYERARASGAAYKTDTKTELYRDPQHGVEFVLRVAAALKDKPKPSKERYGLQGPPLNHASGRACTLVALHMDARPCDSS